MTHASLFSGIGGFDLAAEWAGWTNLFNCEIDPFCQKVLKYHFPNAEQYSDIRKTDFTIWRGRIDVLTGGFPCQPFSHAGKRKGTEDERHLWPEMLRAIREIRPRWVVGENVYGIFNWSDGLVFEQVCSDLEHEGYEVQAYILPAAGVGAPHKRDRVWFVAHRADAGIESMQRSEDSVHASQSIANSECKRGRKIHKNIQSKKSDGQSIDSACHKWNVTDPKGWRLSKSGGTWKRRHGFENNGHNANTPNWDEFPTQSPVCSRDDGISSRLDGITIPRWRIESIKSFGNAVAPLVPLQIFETITEVSK